MTKRTGRVPVQEIRKAGNDFCAVMNFLYVAVKIGDRRVGIKGVAYADNRKLIPGTLPYDTAMTHLDHWRGVTWHNVWRT